MIFKFLIVLLVQVGLPRQADFTVCHQGSGDFLTVQEAIMAVPDFRNFPTIIVIKPGIYKEKIILPTSKTHVWLIGENSENTILTYDDFASKPNQFGEPLGTTASSSFFVFADDFVAKNLTFENSAGPVGQAVAIRISGDRSVFEKCRFLGYQDTLYAQGEKSRQYYKDCYIEGTTDFIFGASTAFFENCHIHSKVGGKYITAASTPQEHSYGFVFMNCRLTGDAPEGSVFLGRPWRSFAKTIFINSELGSHISPQGWHNWGKKEAEQTVFYAEFGNKGLGAVIEHRVSWSKLIHQSEIESTYHIQTVLGGQDQWNPKHTITLIY